MTDKEEAQYVFFKEKFEEWKDSGEFYSNITSHDVEFLIKIIDEEAFL